MFQFLHPAGQALQLLYDRVVDMNLIHVIGVVYRRYNWAAQR